MSYTHGYYISKLENKSLDQISSLFADVVGDFEAGNLTKNEYLDLMNKLTHLVIRIKKEEEVNGR